MLFQFCVISKRNEQFRMLLKFFYQVSIEFYSDVNRIILLLLQKSYEGSKRIIEPEIFQPLLGVSRMKEWIVLFNAV